MSDFPLVGNRTLVETGGFNLSTSGGTVFTSTGTGDSAWTELIASTDADSDLLMLYIMRNDNGNIGRFRLDIGVGAAGSEEVILDDLLLSGKPNGQGQPFALNLPLAIPEGSRVAFRANFSGTTRVMEIAVALYAGGFKTQAALACSKAYGFNGTDGVDVDPGGTVNTKGSWAELDASIAENINGMYVSIGDSANTAQANALWLVDIAIGGAGSEIVVAENIPARGNTSELIKVPVWADVVIASGERVAARAQCTITDATDRVISVSIVGFN